MPSFLLNGTGGYIVSADGSRIIISSRPGETEVGSASARSTAYAAKSRWVDDLPLPRWNATDPQSRWEVTDGH